MCVLSCFSRVWLFVTPWTVACQAPLSMGFPRQEYWNELPCPPSGDLPDPGIELPSPVAPALQVDSLLLSHWGSPLVSHLSNPCPLVQWKRGISSTEPPGKSLEVLWRRATCFWFVPTSSLGSGSLPPLTYWKRRWCWERLKAAGEEGNKGWDVWMASRIHWTWNSASFGGWWGTEKPGVLQSMGLRRVDTTWWLSNNNKTFLQASLNCDTPSADSPRFPGGAWLVNLGLKSSDLHGDNFTENRWTGDLRLTSPALCSISW